MNGVHSQKTTRSVTSRRNEVWGDPIAHSLSPVLHHAAYQALGLDWDYRAVKVSIEQLPDAFSTLPSAVRGLSLTMPLKEAILPLVADHRGAVSLLHAANTVVQDDSGWWLDNTDWRGAFEVIARHGGLAGLSVWLVGAGATARAVLYALAELAPSSVTLMVRNTERALPSVVLAHTLGLSCEARELTDPPVQAPAWVISTLPGGVEVNLPGLRDIAGQSTLFDIAYSPWPSALGVIWREAGSPLVSGREMLLYQAVAQIRGFLHGDTSQELEAEHRVIDAMRSALDDVKE